MKPWLKNRLRTSAYQNIFQELRLKDNEEFGRYLRMNTETYQVKLFIYLFIHFFYHNFTDWKTIENVFDSIFIVVNIPVTLMELFYFIYHGKYYIDHESTNITTINSPYSIF